MEYSIYASVSLCKSGNVQVSIGHWSKGHVLMFMTKGDLDTFIGPPHRNNTV